MRVLEFNRYSSLTYMPGREGNEVLAREEDGIVSVIGGYFREDFSCRGLETVSSHRPGSMIPHLDGHCFYSMVIEIRKLK